MQNYALTWTNPDGIPCASAVAYDQPSADRRRSELETAGCTEVTVVPTKPGQLPEPRG
ncbi:hypothetical protein [Streptomyces prasinopilosus]|uniref:hypothetical protein n=1 Tax=Streptomyces prasinopilosus TaxID=67344 RepID=UPI000B2EBA4D|nr:hypothetical protein [Streptomyces prasinopilosus]